MAEKPVDSSFAKFLLWQADAPKEITDTEAAQQLDLDEDSLVQLQNALPGAVSVDTLSEFDCPACGAKVDLPEGARNAYCETCSKLWLEGQFPTKAYSFDRSVATDYLLTKAEAELRGLQWEVEVQQDPPRLLTHSDAVRIGVGVLPRTAKLRDYLTLRGSLEDPARAVVALVAPHFEDLVLYYTQNTPEALLVDSFEWLQGKLVLAPALLERARNVSASIRVSERIGAHFEELAVAEDIGEQMHRLLQELPFLSLQLAEGSRSAIGNRFQRAALTVLNIFSPFKILPVGGKNQEDGVLRFYFPGTDKKAQWYPVGVKSFRGDLEREPYYPVAQAGEQMRKYARAYVQEESVVGEVEVPAYLLIAHDFDMKSQEVQEEIRAFESDVGLPMKLLPVRTILTLVKGFAELHPDRVPNEPLVEFISEPGAYLDDSRAERLLAGLRAYHLQERKDLKIARVRDRLRKHHA